MEYRGLKSAKVQIRVQSTEYRVQSTDYGGEESVSAKVQIGLRPVERCEDEKGVKRGTGNREIASGQGRL